MNLFRTKIVLRYLLVTLIISGPVHAAFYCDVIPINCAFSAYGWQDTCGNSCELCGEENCPAKPEVSTLSLLAESSCRKKLIDNHRIRQCNSSLVEAASDRAYAGLFTPACAEHSVCYHSEGYSKQRCDKHFEQNIQQICNKLYGLQPNQRWWLNEMNKPSLDECMSAAAVWSGIVRESGLGTFSNEKSWGVRNCPIE
ncbi:MAG: hypothetical protein ACC707_07650 [Thiohalomonadales bacterium]